MKKIYALLMVIVLSAIVTSIVVVTKDKKKTDTSSQDASSAASAPAESVPGRESSAPDEQSFDISEPEGSSELETTSEEESSEDESSEPEESSEEEPATTAEAIVKLAYKLIGTEYKYGGEGPDKFDNSGFTYYVCRQCGVKAPRLVGGMMNFGTEVGRNELQPGDILIFRNEIDGPPAFMGIYVGDDQFIACNNETTPTKLQKISNYWNARFVCGRRVG